jgi:N-acetylglucosaminyl-diphospho-decaprenol L-rhamnosyltransferase
MSGPPDASILIVGLNARQHTLACLESLAAEDLGPYTAEVIYVDNGSRDSSAAEVRRRFPEVKVIANECNVGFCAANNQAAEIATAPLLYLLNNDTLVERGSIRPLIEFLHANPRAAVAANRLLNADRSDQWSARRFPSWRSGLFGRRTPFASAFADSAFVRRYLYKDQMEQGEPFEVDWVPGSCTMVRRDVYWKAGGLPSEMHYWSDAVFCHRIRRLGGAVYVVPSAPLVHLEGQGAGRKSRQLQKWLVRDFHEGAYRFYCEYHRLHRWSPLRWTARAALSARAWLMIQAEAAWRNRSDSSSGGVSSAC